jgi:Uma2 family endonuclease
MCRTYLSCNSVEGAPVASLPNVPVTPEAYLHRERQSPTKSEYHQGEVVAMSGASRAHNLIAANLSREVGTRLEEAPCEVYQSDMRVRVSPQHYFYPDVVVVCGEPRFSDEQVDTLLNPTVVVEVLSPSTEAADRGRKFMQYRRLESLREYVLVAQDEPYVECYRREDDGRWVLEVAEGLEAVLRLPSVGCEVPLDRIYRRLF